MALTERGLVYAERTGQVAGDGFVAQVFGGGAQVVCAGHGFIRNLAGGFYDLGREPAVLGLPPRPLLLQAWEELTQDLLAG